MEGGRGWAKFSKKKQRPRSVKTSFNHNLLYTRRSVNVLSVIKYNFLHNLHNWALRSAVVFVLKQIYNYNEVHSKLFCNHYNDVRSNLVSKDPQEIADVLPSGS
jgi:hypothetical protein